VRIPYGKRMSAKNNRDLLEGNIDREGVTSIAKRGNVEPSQESASTNG
jgi:hypothetical protein